MANWQRRLKIKKEFEQYNDNEITLSQFAKAVSDKLLALEPLPGVIDLERLRLAEEFKAFSEETDPEEGDFDELAEQLYDWADTPLDDHWNGKKVCWVETII